MPLQCMWFLRGVLSPISHRSARVSQDLSLPSIVQNKYETDGNYLRSGVRAWWVHHKQSNLSSGVKSQTRVIKYKTKSRSSSTYVECLYLYWQQQYSRSKRKKYIKIYIFFVGPHLSTTLGSPFFLNMSSVVRSCQNALNPCSTPVLTDWSCALCSLHSAQKQIALDSARKHFWDKVNLLNEHNRKQMNRIIIPDLSTND